jgi:hypothetical protein
MKHLLLPLCCAGVLASASELKEPADIAHHWKHTVDEAKQPVAALTLAGQTDLSLRPSQQTFDFGFEKPRIYHRKLPDPLYDAPSHRNRGIVPIDRPRGAKPWEYNGEIYWIVPLSPAKTI